MDDRDVVSLETPDTGAAPTEEVRPGAHGGATRPADGDDLVVVATDTPAGPTRRRRLFLIGAAAVAVAAVAVAGALVAGRHHSAPAVVRTSPTLAPVPVGIAPTVRTVPKLKPTVPAVHVKAPTVAVTVPTTRPQQTNVTSGSVAPPPPVPAPTTVPAPKQYGATVLTWTAPRQLTIAAGKSAVVSVTAHNPTDGTVTLPHPLACAPRLDHAEMCTENVQLIGVGQSASAQYTIDATGIAPGHYTLDIEGVLTISVTVA